MLLNFVGFTWSRLGTGFLNGLRAVLDKLVWSLHHHHQFTNILSNGYPLRYLVLCSVFMVLTNYRGLDLNDPSHGFLPYMGGPSSL
jgi:hypothetical protein